MIDGKRLIQNYAQGQGSPASAARPSRSRPGPSLPPAACRWGFTAIEIMVVVAVIAILLIMAVPALSMLAPQYTLGSSAKAVDSMAQNARLLAGNTQKPTRLVVDCRAGSQTDPNSRCTMRLYTANFTDAGEIDLTTPWTEVPMMRRDVSNRVTVTSAPATVVSGNPDNVYWVVFLPTGKASTSHDPMRLRFRVASGKSATVEVGISRHSGRVTTRIR